MPATVLALRSVVATTVILAHQGGWDEMLMVAVPIAVFAVLLYIANNRASKLGDDDQSEITPEAGDGETRQPDATRQPGRAETTRTHRKADHINPHRGPI